MWWLDRLFADLLVPLAAGVLASGLDDIFPDLTFLYLWCRDRWRRRGEPLFRLGDPPLDATTPEGQPRIAILIPCWREDGVIERMLDHNLPAIDDRNYDVWLGLYPNDQATLEKVLGCQARFPRVRRVLCPHDGPTTKADCLNWIYQGILRHERQTGERYEIILHHDAEDVIHPQSLRAIREGCERFEMVQIPVFPLPAPLHNFTHGAYADEFAESHLKELYVRARLGGFVPSAGVGTAYRRAALERLESVKGGQIFDPESLTEDYFIGLELHRLGCSQTLLHSHPERGRWRAAEPCGRPGSAKAMVATRAFFPRRLPAAIRQRTRWVVGNVLQSWQRFGWRVGWRQWYWLWRDRKGLLGYPLTALANLIFCYALAQWVWARGGGEPSFFLSAVAADPVLVWLLAFNLALLAWRLFVRGLCAYQVYGLRHAVFVPLRAPWVNLINFCATARALAVYGAAQLRHRPISWTKTRHEYPPHPGVAASPRLGEILVSMQLVSPLELAAGLRQRQPRERIGEQLVRSARLSEDQLYQALSVQHGLPFRHVTAADVDSHTVDQVPPAVSARWQFVPLHADTHQELWLAGPEAPTGPVQTILSEYCRQRLRFLLITPTNYRSLAEHLGRHPARSGTRLAAHPAGSLPGAAPANGARTDREHPTPAADSRRPSSFLLPRGLGLAAEPPDGRRRPAAARGGAGLLPRPSSWHTARRCASAARRGRLAIKIRARRPAWLGALSRLSLTLRYRRQASAGVTRTSAQYSLELATPGESRRESPKVQAFQLRLPLGGE